MGFQDQLSLNAGQKYCREHSAILLAYIVLPHGFKAFVLSIFEWPLKTVSLYCGTDKYLTPTQSLSSKVTRSPSSAQYFRYQTYSDAQKYSLFRGQFHVEIYSFSVCDLCPDNRGVYGSHLVKHKA